MKEAARKEALEGAGPSSDVGTLPTEGAPVLGCAEGVFEGADGVEVPGAEGVASLGGMAAQVGAIGRARKQTAGQAEGQPHSVGSWAKRLQVGLIWAKPDEAKAV